jgi:hypothetical protein
VRGSLRLACRSLCRSQRDVHLREMPLVHVGKVLPRVTAAALFAGERRARHRFADDQHVAHVDRLVPGRVVVTVAVDLHP